MAKSNMDALKRAIKLIGTQRKLASWLQHGPSETVVSNWITETTPIPKGVIQELKRREPELRLVELMTTQGEQVILKKDLLPILKAINDRLTAIEKRLKDENR